MHTKPLTTQEALWQAILKHPEEMTVRLEYADYLDGLDVPRVKCLRCNGKSKGGTTWSLIYTGTGYREHIDKAICKYCDNTGTVPDMSNADRAELIQIQVELAKWYGWKEDNRGEELQHRGRQLLAAHSDWSKIECKNLTPRACPVCYDSGNLLEKRHYDNGTYTKESRIKGWCAGYPSEVSCTLEEVLGRSINEPIFLPTQWAIELIKTIPVVCFRVTDREAFNWLSVSWEPTSQVYKDFPWGWTISKHPSQDNHWLPYWLYHKLKGYGGLDGGNSWSSKEAAEDCLGRYLATLVRTYVWGKNDDES